MRISLPSIQHGQILGVATDDELCVAMAAYLSKSYREFSKLCCFKKNPAQGSQNDERRELSLAAF
jgi:hypothetical protein